MYSRDHLFKGTKPQEIPLQLGLFSAQELKESPHVARIDVSRFVGLVENGLQDPHVLPRLRRPQKLIVPNRVLAIEDAPEAPAALGAPAPEVPLYSETAADPAKGVTGIFKLSYETLTEEDRQIVVEKLKDYVAESKDIKVAGTAIYVRKSGSTKRPVPSTIIREVTVSGPAPKLQKIETGKGKSLDPAWEQISRRF
jgi:hypothetical protein